jgi:hypothetical protein
VEDSFVLFFGLNLSLKFEIPYVSLVFFFWKGGGGGGGGVLMFDVFFTKDG